MTRDALFRLPHKTLKVTVVVLQSTDATDLEVRVVPAVSASTPQKPKRPLSERTSCFPCATRLPMPSAREATECQVSGQDRRGDHCRAARGA